AAGERIGSRGVRGSSELRSLRRDGGRGQGFGREGGSAPERQHRQARLGPGQPSPPKPTGPGCRKPNAERGSCLGNARPARGGTRLEFNWSTEPTAQSVPVRPTSAPLGRQGAPTFVGAP